MKTKLTNILPDEELKKIISAFDWAMEVMALTARETMDDRCDTNMEWWQDKELPQKHHITKLIREKFEALITEEFYESMACDLMERFMDSQELYLSRQKPDTYTDIIRTINSLTPEQKKTLTAQLKTLTL